MTQLIPQLVARHSFVFWSIPLFYLNCCYLCFVKPVWAVISTFTFKWRPREEIYGEEEPQGTIKEPWQQRRCNFVTYTSLALTPHLRAVSLPFLLDPGVAFQVGDNITVGSAISSMLIIHLEEPALHFHVVQDELAESMEQLQSRDTKILRTVTTPKCSSDFQFPNIWGLTFIF